jgi:hypothetical protein
LKTIIAQSLNTNATEAVSEIKEKFAAELSHIKAIAFFAASTYNSAELMEAMNKEFKDITVFGSSSGGEIISGNMTDNSLVAMAYTDEVFENVKVEIVENLSKGVDIQNAVDSFSEYFGTPFNKLDASKYFGLSFVVFSAAAEEALFDEIGDNTKGVFVGATSADNWRFVDTTVYGNNHFYKDAAVLVLIKPKVEFAFEKIEAVTDTGHSFIVTKSDHFKKTIDEADNRPVAEVYAEALGYSINEIRNFQVDDFRQYPLGIMIDGAIYLRNIFFTRPENDSFYMVCGIQEGTKVHIFKAENLITHTQVELARIKAKHHNISSILTFNCMQRYQDSCMHNQMKEYGELFSDINTVGLCSYGEYYLGPVNQTATFLILK